MRSLVRLVGTGGTGLPTRWCDPGGVRWPGTFTATLMQAVKEQEQGPGPAAPPPRKGHHFLEVYADRGRTSTVALVR